MELEVKYPNKTIELLPWWDTDLDIINTYLEKIKPAIKRVAEYYRTDTLFIDNCVVLPLTYVLKFIIQTEKRVERFEKGVIVYSDEYAIILLNDDEYEEDYIDEKEACFVIEPYKPFDP